MERWKIRRITLSPRLARIVPHQQETGDLQKYEKAKNPTPTTPPAEEAMTSSLSSYPGMQYEKTFALWTKELVVKGLLHTRSAYFLPRVFIRIATAGVRGQQSDGFGKTVEPGQAEDGNPGSRERSVAA